MKRVELAKLYFLTHQTTKRAGDYPDGLGDVPN